jgi:hypothetical protein
MSDEVAEELSEIASRIAGRLESDSTLADAICQVASAIVRLGNNNASTPMGAIEALGAAIIESADRISNSIDGLANAIGSLKQ